MRHRTQRTNELGAVSSFNQSLHVHAGRPPRHPDALDLQLMVTNGRFTDLKVENVTVSGLEIDASSSRLSLGVSWWP